MYCFADAEQRSARKVPLFPQNFYKRVWWIRVIEKITTENTDYLGNGGDI